jgi:hypothetical protein
MDTIRSAASASARSPSIRARRAACSGVMPRVQSRHAESAVSSTEAAAVCRPRRNSQRSGPRLQTHAPNPGTTTWRTVPSRAGTSRIVCGNARMRVSRTGPRYRGPVSPARPVASQICCGCVQYSLKSRAASSQTGCASGPAQVTGPPRASMSADRQNSTTSSPTSESSATRSRGLARRAIVIHSSLTRSRKRGNASPSSGRRTTKPSRCMDSRPT